MTSCATIYKGTSLKTKEKVYQSMAILPFDVHFEGKKIYKQYSLESIKNMEQEESIRLQNELYVLMLKK